MRPVVPALIALLVLSVPVGAQDPAAGEPLLEDESGDVVVRAAGTDGAASPPASDRVDILALYLTETPTSLEAAVAVVAMEQDANVFHQVAVTFEYAGRGYRAFASSSLGSDYFAYFGVRDDGTGRYTALQTLDVVTDRAGATIHLSIPRELIVGADGAPLVPGRSIESVHVLSEANQFLVLGGPAGETTGGSIRDEAGDATLPLRYGVEQSGHARLASETPYRSSNGAATTFVFRVDASNLAEDDDRFRLAVQDVPSGWDVSLPADRLDLGAGGEQSVPVVVRTPFVHQHGSAERFLLTMTSDTDPTSVGRVELGVRYPAIPQPAGHHDTLWLHGVAGSDDPLSTSIGLLNEGLAGRGNYDDQVLMNTVEGDERFPHAPVEGYACGTSPNGTSPTAPTYCWDVYLDPGLDMGLDFDLSRTGTVEVPFHALVPTNGARLTGQLLWFGPPEREEVSPGFVITTRETVPLADLAGGEAADIGLDGEATLTATVTPLPAADLVRYQKGAGLLLSLQMETDRVDYAFFGPHQEPELLPGGVLRLPLLEYADPVDEVFSGATTIRVDAITEQERLLNPGDTAVFTVDVAHVGDGRDTYTARIVGGNSDWATLLGPTTFTLKDNGTQRLSVSVLAPDDARDEDQADLVLEVASTTDLGARALVRLVATVDTDEEHPDDAEQAKALAKSAGKKSPGAGVPVLLAALAALAVARRPRRRA